MKNTNSLADHLLNAQAYIQFHGCFNKYFDNKDQWELTRTEALNYWVKICDSYWKIKEQDITDLVITRLSQSIIENDYK